MHQWPRHRSPGSPVRRETRESKPALKRKAELSPSWSGPEKFLEPAAALALRARSCRLVIGDLPRNTALYAKQLALCPQKLKNDMVLATALLYWTPHPSEGRIMVLPMEIAEEALQSIVSAAELGNEALFAALEALPAPIYFTDADGMVSHYNQACIGFAGRIPVVGKDQSSRTGRLHRTQNAWTVWTPT